MVSEKVQEYPSTLSNGSPTLYNCISDFSISEDPVLAMQILHDLHQFSMSYKLPNKISYEFYPKFYSLQNVPQKENHESHLPLLKFA